MTFPVGTLVMAIIITTYTFSCVVILGMHLRKTMQKLKKLEDEK